MSVSTKRRFLYDLRKFGIKQVHRSNLHGKKITKQKNTALASFSELWLKKAVCDVIISLARNLSYEEANQSDVSFAFYQLVFLTRTYDFLSFTSRTAMVLRRRQLGRWKNGVTRGWMVHSDVRPAQDAPRECLQLRAPPNKGPLKR